MTHPVHIVLASALLVTFPSAAAIFSYLFTADAYFLCLMLNALAVYCTRNYRWGWLFGLPLLCSDSKIGMYDGSSQLRYTAAMRVTNTRSVPVINAAG